MCAHWLRGKAEIEDMTNNKIGSRNWKACPDTQEDTKL